MKICLVILTGLLTLVSSAYAGDFSDNNNGTITDNVTGLVWQQSDDYISRSWEQAISYCEALVLGRTSDWRLPNVKELRSIVDESKINPAIDLDMFRRTVWSGYWTSTTYNKISTDAWVVEFAYGYVDYSYKIFSYYVRCVRGGS
ncbi:MAG: DUF1566 domain-containing protein [Proteobacteria bacterium]|nr:DUF1566 domain-containing protein [Pseudomonadota bacterium]MBU1688364.1 DUF1566 domain-containing protein [Pseudomonadota bacterium]